MKFILITALAALAVARPGNPWEDVKCPAPVTVTEYKVEYQTKEVEKPVYVTAYQTAYVTKEVEKDVTVTVTAYKTQTEYKTITGICSSSWSMVCQADVSLAPPVTVTSTYYKECEQKTWGDWQGKGGK